MAIPINKNTNPIDNKNEKFVGIKIPFEKSEGREGYFTSTSTTMEAVKENIRNLLYTKRGERVFQPTLGIGLENYIFENYTEETGTLIKDDIETTLGIWLPFVTIVSMDIGMIGENKNNLENNKINIDIKFYINQNPSMLDSLEVILG